MQLALLMVMVTFTHLSCEEQSQASPNIFGEMNYLPKDCKDRLKAQIEDQCEGHKFQPELQWVTECKFKCGYENNDGYIKTTTGQTYNLKDGTPCGHSRVCINGDCVDTCSMRFV
uniref:THR2 n=1 Tax=Ixodes pacificus TaxID=29930 RepID=Q6B874_IXOPA|nr:THR2 [Ixodes pacificus]